MTTHLAVVTGTRAEYGLLYPLLKEIEKSQQLKYSLIVTGSHLSPHHGNTIDEIKKDNIPISHIVDMEISGDTEKDICDSIALGLKGFSNIFKNNSFDAIIVLGGENIEKGRNCYNFKSRLWFIISYY